MAAVMWRRWSALCLLGGAIVVPLFLEVFAGGSFVRFLALPLRYAWAFYLGGAILRERWIEPRAVAAGLAAFVVLLSGSVLSDLCDLAWLHLGWFLTLEWWQRPLWPWLDLTPRAWLLDRPLYLWLAAAWNLVEGLAAAAWLWRWNGGRTPTV